MKKNTSSLLPKNIYTNFLVFSLLFFGVFFINIAQVFAQKPIFKYALRDEKTGKTAFFYTDKQKQPQHIYHRLSTEKEKTKFEILGDYKAKGNSDLQYSDGLIKVRNPKTKEEFVFQIDEFMVRIMNPAKTDEEGIIYSPEYGFELGKERFYGVMSPVGFGVFYYMPNPQTAPKKIEILNLEEAFSGEKPYLVDIPKEGKTQIEYNYDTKKLTLTNLKTKTKKVFLEKTDF